MTRDNEYDGTISWVDNPHSFARMMIMMTTLIFRTVRFACTKTGQALTNVYGWYCIMLVFTFSPSEAQAEETAAHRPNVVKTAGVLSGRPLRQVSLVITPPAGFGADGKPFPLPTDRAAEVLALPLRPEYREFSQTEFGTLGDWNFCYQPLLFEEVNAERYGEVCPGLQPAVSATKFYGRVMLLPYSVISTAARKPQYFPHADRPGYGGIHEKAQ